MKPKQLRRLALVIHTLGAASIGVFIYSPWSSIPEFAMLVRFVVLPLIAFSGLLMWKPKWFWWLTSPQSTAMKPESPANQ